MNNLLTKTYIKANLFKDSAKYYFKNQDGVTMLEYAVIALVVGVVGYTVFSQFGEKIQSVFSTLTNNMQGTIDSANNTTP